MDYSILKVFSVKDGYHHYYVQEMPLPWADHRVYRVMKDRRIMIDRTFDNRALAIRALLWHLSNDYGLSIHFD